jgi:RNA polymerase-binding protein DksA
LNPKWAWHYRTLLQVRERLLKDRSEQLKDAAEPVERHSLSIADSATDEFDHSLALSTLSSEQDALYEVDEALRRIEEGTYGRCEETGKPIAAARLRAIPWTRFSREVAARLERKGIVRRPRLGRITPLRGTEARRSNGAEPPDEEQRLAPTDETLRRVHPPTEVKPAFPSDSPLRRRQRR